MSSPRRIGGRRVREADDAEAPRSRHAALRPPAAAVRDDALLFELVAARFPEAALPAHREICSRLRWCPPLVAGALDRGALRGFVEKADERQADALRTSLASSRGHRVHPSRWVAAVKVAIWRRSAPAVQALLEAYRGGEYEALVLGDDDWVYATGPGRDLSVLRTLLADGRVDLGGALYIAVKRPDALALILRDARADAQTTNAALARACKAVLTWVREGSMCGSSSGRFRSSRYSPLESLDVVLSHPLVDVTHADHAALIAAAAAGSEAFFRSVLARDVDPPPTAFAAALRAAARRVGPEWDESPAFQGHNLPAESGFTCHGETVKPPAALVAARYDRGVLAALVSHPGCSATAAAVALKAAARVYNRDAVLLLMGRLGGPAAVPAALRFIVLGVIARIPPRFVDGIEEHSLQPWLPALRDASAATEAADWADDGPLVSALLAAPGFDPSAEGGGAGLLARATKAGRLGCVRCLLGDTRIAVPAPPPPFLEHPDEDPYDVLRDDLLAIAIGAGRPAVTAAVLASPRVPRTHIGLAAAAGAGLLPVVLELLAAGVAPSPLAMSVAAFGGSCAAFAALVQAGGDPGALLQDGATPLLAAVTGRHAAVVRQLLTSWPAVVEFEAPTSVAVTLAARQLMRADSESEAAASFEILRIVLAEPRFSACRALDAEDAGVRLMTDEALACVMAAPSFDPSHPSVINAVVAAARYRPERRLRALLSDPRVDPSARGNAALTRACSQFLESLESTVTPDWACEDALSSFVDDYECEDIALRTVDVLLSDARVVERGVHRALAVAAEAGSHRIVRRLLEVDRGGAGAALVAAASGLHSELVSVILEGGWLGDAPTSDAMRAAFATFRSQALRRQGSWSIRVPDLFPAYARLVGVLLEDPRASPAPVAEDFPEHVRSWAVMWGACALERVEEACPAVLRAPEMHVTRVDEGRYCPCALTNDIAIDFLLSRTLASDRDVDTLFEDRSSFDPCITADATRACIRRALRRGNIPLPVVLRIAALGTRQPWYHIETVLCDVVSARHDAAYSACGALPADRWRAHTADGSCPALAGEDWCQLRHCASCSGPSAGSAAAGADSDVDCALSHCPGRCCDGGEAMLECVSALLALPHVDPALRSSEVLIAAVKNSAAPPSVLDLLLRDGRADPREQPSLLAAACARRPTSPGIVAALLADPRVIVTPDALTAAVGSLGFDFLGPFLLRQQQQLQQSQLLLQQQQLRQREELLRSPEATLASSCSEGGCDADSAAASVSTLGGERRQGRVCGGDAAAEGRKGSAAGAEQCQDGSVSGAVPTPTGGDPGHSGAASAAWPGEAALRAPLVSAATAGLGSAVRRLLSVVGAGAASVDDIREALVAAAAAGQAHCALVLLSVACARSCAPGDGTPATGAAAFDAGAALVAASAGGHADTASTLLRRCDRREPECPGHCSRDGIAEALRAAASAGHAEAVRVLLLADPGWAHSGASAAPPPPGAAAGPPVAPAELLLRAATRGHTEVLGVLLCDPPRYAADDEDLGAAAAAAAGGGHAGAVRVLLAAARERKHVALRALNGAVDAAQAGAIRAALSAAGGDVPAEALASAALRLCARVPPQGGGGGGAAACLHALTASPRHRRIVVDALAADGSAAFRSLCGLVPGGVREGSRLAELVAAVLELRAGEGDGGSAGVDPAAGDCAALHAAAASGFAEVVRVLLADARVGVAKAAASARAVALVSAAQRGGCKGAVWLLAPRVADAGALLDAAEACVRRGDAETLRGILAHVDADAEGAARRVRELSQAAPARGLRAHVLRSHVDQAADAWLARLSRGAGPGA